ncbi:MAG: DUF1398 family protein [Chitinophagaceae bacterium]
MLTLQDILSAHSKVKTGADFPAYIETLRKLGVTGYEFFVADGHLVFQDSNGLKLKSEAKYPVQAVAANSDTARLTADLKIHQAGGSGFLTFCGQAAGAGVHNWIVDIPAMTCTYYNTNGDAMLQEVIPAMLNSD